MTIRHFFTTFVPFTEFIIKVTATMNEFKQSDFHLHAEWEQQSGVMLAWPHEDTDWAPYLTEIEDTYVKLIDAITSHEYVLLVARDVDKVKAKLREKLRRIQYLRIIFRQCDYNDTWARDFGPITLTSHHHTMGFFVPNHLLDFHFNGWGQKYPADLDDAVNVHLYFSGIFYGALENHSDFVLEGGALETDGYGTLFLTRSSQVAPNRNQPLTPDQIDKRLRTIFDFAQRIVWLEHGQLIGDDTDGHIDTLMRCAPNHTLLYIGTDDKDDPQYEELKLMEEQIQSIKTLEGGKYNLLKLPLPDKVEYGGERLPATYANFLVINGAVIVPTYNQPEKDKQALEIIGKAFPGREIIGIDSLVPIRQHGSFHCLTMQLPEGVLITDDSYQFT